MKTGILVFLSGLILLSSINLKAQNWANGGNALTANGTLGTTTNFSLSFKSNNKERGRLTNNGLWGFGTTNPDSKVHINSAAGQVPLRVEVNKETKFLVHSDGGVSIGSGIMPPANGLFVLGNTGIGTSTPENSLHVYKGNAGDVTGYFDAPLIVENSESSYINILAPDANETGILFGKPASNLSGGIIYNNAATSNGLQFRTNGNQTKMILSDQGNLGVGTDPDVYKLRIRHGGGTARGISIENENLAPTDNWEIFNGGDLLLSWRNKFLGSFNTITGSYTSISDERLKTNIKPMGNLLEKINRLKPSTYQFKNTTDKQEYNGFIAQDVLKLFPAMVSHTVIPERKLDVYTLDYSQFGVLAIKGIQELLPVIEEQKQVIEEQKQVNEEQKQVNEKQKQKIAALEDKVAKLEMAFASITATKNASVPDAVANISLEQNAPNPFTNATTIRYHIPQGSKGRINIYDATGKMIKALDANESGHSELNGSDLGAGTYTYTLTLNGKVVLSKQMLTIK